MPKAKIKKDAVILTARQLLQGYVAGNSLNLYNLTPLQMLPESEKTEDWKKWNMDWIERAGLRMLSRDNKKMVKNYHLANGLIDKTDYIIGEDNEFSDVIDIIAEENQNTIPIRFFPLIPNIINVLCGEFSKRINRIIAYAVDDDSRNEKEEAKNKAVADVLMQYAQGRKMQEFADMGLLENPDEQAQEYMNSQMEAVKQLNEIENRFKTYKSRAEQWANHMIELDTQRFSMYQLESKGFRDMLVTDREFWHVKITEDGDYKVELWNPLNTFFHKSPETQWVSEGNYAGRILLMSVPDVIDTYGFMMNEEQLESLRTNYSITGSGGAPPILDAAYSGRADLYTDYSKPYPHSITNKTTMQWRDGKIADQLRNDNMFKGSWYDLQKGSSDWLSSFESPGMLRVTEGYWKSQKKYGELTIKGPDGIPITTIVDENFVVTEEPKYDKSIRDVEEASNLVSGEHIDWFWTNEVRSFVKIGSSMLGGMILDRGQNEAIYIGGDPIPFQIKGHGSLFGARLPVEGTIFSERNSQSSSLVDKTKSHQISYNIVNNQIIEMLADNEGKAIVIDQGMIPRNSMGKEWGPHNFAMMHQIRKDYSVIPVDTSMRNTEGGTNFNHFQAVDLSKTEQILGNIQLAQYFKNECMEAVGISAQRLGQITPSESATGVDRATQNSYNQTETYFDQHMNHLMPRVRQIMLDVAQYVGSKKALAGGSYYNNDEEVVMFDVPGEKLELAQLQIFTGSTADIRQTVERLQQMAMQNNTAGGSLSEIAEVLSLHSPAAIKAKLKEAEAKRQEQMQGEHSNAMQLQQQQQQFLAQEEEKRMALEDKWKELAARTQIIVAQIRASQSENNDMNANSVPDPLEAMDILHQQKISTEQLLNEQTKTQLQQQKQLDEKDLARQKMDLEREGMASKERIEAMKLKNPVVGETKKKK